MQNEEVNLPNSVLVGSMTVNYSRKGDPRVILTTTVTIGYSSPWRQVHRLLLEAADRTPGLLKEPEPFVRQRALSDFYVEYQICAYLEVPRERIPTLSALHANIQDLFNEHGVQIMSPHYLDDPAEKVWVPKERWLGDEGAEPDAGRDTEATPPAGRRSSRRRPARPPTG
jgi:small-conductance mechanosensitive channel